MFTVAEREAVSAAIVERARSWPDIVAGAVVGSLADGPGDAFSDIDLTFAVRDGVDRVPLVEAWSVWMREQFGADVLLDVTSGPTLYRVFLLPSALQVDLSFTPEPSFAPAGPQFRLLFGSAGPSPGPRTPRDPADLYGWAVHHLLRARLCLERGRLWQSEFWIAHAREIVFQLAAQRRGWRIDYGRTFDDLPAVILEPMRRSLVGELTREALLRAIGAVGEGLLAETDGVESMATRLRPHIERFSRAEF